MDRNSDLRPFKRCGEHKGFYNADDLENALRNVHYEKFFKSPDDDEFSITSADDFLCGVCTQFAVALYKALNYTPYIIESSDKKGFHAFCQVLQNERIYYVDVRGMTSSFEEFMSGVRQFVKGEYTISQVTQDVVDKWENDSEYHQEACAFANAMIKEYVNYYTI